MFHVTLCYVADENTFYDKLILHQKGTKMLQVVLKYLARCLHYSLNRHYISDVVITIQLTQEKLLFLTLPIRL